ncbi:MAG: hypothetical protein HY751_05375 [Nitrospinae bacterium]|nr:hypothetical protein [Nitrospinota bacterium]
MDGKSRFTAMVDCAKMDEKRRPYMKHHLLLGAAVLIMSTAACTEPKAVEQPAAEQQAPQTVREQAETAGKLGDQTVTKDLEKNLTGVVDSSAEHNKELDAAGK